MLYWIVHKNKSDWNHYWGAGSYVDCKDYSIVYWIVYSILKTIQYYWCTCMCYFMFLNQIIFLLPCNTMLKVLTIEQIIPGKSFQEVIFQNIVVLSILIHGQCSAKTNYNLCYNSYLFFNVFWIYENNTTKQKDHKYSTVFKKSCRRYSIEFPIDGSNL